MTEVKVTAPGQVVVQVHSPEMPGKQPFAGRVPPHCHPDNLRSARMTTNNVKDMQCSSLRMAAWPLGRHAKRIHVIFSTQQHGTAASSHAHKLTRIAICSPMPTTRRPLSSSWSPGQTNSKTGQLANPSTAWSLAEVAESVDSGM